MKINDKPIVVEETFNSSISDVWKAITELDQMQKWYFDNIPAFKAEVGFENEFIIKNEGRVFPHKWKITEVIPLKKISYSWNFEGYPGSSISEFELSEEKDLVMLRLTVIVLEDFPDDIPEFKRESCLGGWNYFIKGNLKNYLEN